MRLSYEITDEDVTTLADRRDPSGPGLGAHLEFHQILRRCGTAWLEFLESLEVYGEEVIVPRLEVDYRAEVLAGVLDIDVSVVRLGTTSYTLQCRASQEGRAAAEVEVVIVNYDYASKRAVPLSDERRARLGELSRAAEPD